MIQSRNNFAWYHIIWNTLGSWLPGNQRGFRNFDHRIHSSGDYKNPPPSGEHAGLYRYNRDRARQPVHIPSALRPLICDAILDAAGNRNLDSLAWAIGDQHVHGLVRFQLGEKGVKRNIGDLKTVSSLSVSDTMPGSIWSRGCSPKIVRTQEHLVSTLNYVVFKQEVNAWVWDFKQGGRFLRR